MNPQDTKAVLEAAQRWIGKYFRKDQSAQCANFVRQVFKDAGVYVGSAAAPDDHELIPGYPTGEGYADSFAGPDVGTLVPRCQRQPGDIIMYADTYGDYPKGTITHVGIYAGNDLIIHRPTAAGVVRQDRYNYATIAEIRRVPSNPLQAAIVITPSNICSLYNGSVVENLKIKIYLRSGKLSAVIDNVFADRVVNVSLFAAIPDRDNIPILYMSASSCIYQGKPIDNKQVLVETSGQRAVVYVDGREIAGCSLSLYVSFDRAAAAKVS